MTNLKNVLLGTVLLSTFSLQAQQIQRHVLNWEGPGELRTKSADSPLQVTFQGAMLDSDRDQLPFFAETVALKANVASFEVNIIDAQYEVMSTAEMEALPGLKFVEEQLEVNTHLSWHQKQPIALVNIYPYRKLSNSQQFEKLLSFEYEIIPQLGNGVSGFRKSYPANSVMQNGSWYRFSLQEDGVYVIDYQFLESLGVDMNGLASNDINIYGNHIGQLPYENSVPRPTDLLLNNILVEDGADGTFDNGDRILFYATGPASWDRGSDVKFVHNKNVFTDSATYFVGIGVEAPARIQDVSLSTATPNQVVTEFDDRQFYERNNINLIKSGREFYGEAFDLVLQYNFQFNLPFLVPNDSVCLEVDVFSRTINTSNSSSFNVNVGSFSETINVQGVPNSYIGAYGRPARQLLKIPNVSSGAMQISMEYVKNNPITSLGWLNWLRVNARRELKFVGDQLLFRDTESVGVGNVSEFQLDLSANVYRIWEITDPTRAGNIPANVSGNLRTWSLSTDSLRQFVAFRNSGYLTPTAVGPLQNQNLHATGQPDMVVVCHPLFWNEAQRLVDRRISEGLDVVMVTPQQVYNEFSSGMRDATAIKWYMKMLYDRAGSDVNLLPRYLLLFGDGSYNNVSVNSSNQNFIPTYQTSNSFNLSASYCSDDYFGLLDDGEGEFSGDLVDIGIGRLAAHTAGQAKQLVDKVLRYDQLSLNSQTSVQCDEDGGSCVKDWRNRVLFVSDDQEGESFEGTVHMSQSETLASIVETDEPEFIVDRIFMDAYQQISTPGGERYPDGQESIKDAVQKGQLVVNYIGHGGEVGWGHERYLDISTILGWTNRDCMPLFMTATCEFTRWDDPARTSAGEFVMLNPDGGGIGLMTTTRLAYSSSNFALSNDFYDHVFRTDDGNGNAMRLGDIYRNTKVDISTSQPGSVNHRNFCLLGDPSTILAHPKNQVIVTSVTDTAGVPNDTLRALSLVRVEGIVADAVGNQLTDFNGVVIPTVFDKRKNIVTLANDQQGSGFAFNLWKNVIHRGQATVANGAFTFEFVVPKDIAYQFGPGRMAFYAESNESNAHGNWGAITVGGTDPNASSDDEGPSIDLYMNDENFVSGGITDETPLLVAELFDINGINTLGTSIGHDLKAIVDGQADASIILNDFYEADLDTYQSGTVRYRMDQLAVGPHTVELKAWDVHNNSAKTTTEFVVASSAELALEHVLNYPNPFTTRTEFFFEHNKSCSFLDVQLQVYTVSGRLVKTISERLSGSGFRSSPIEWDGRDEYGDKLARGVYVYKLNVVTPEGEKAEKLEKLVILK